MGRKIGAFGLVNYRRHPENDNYIVFNFNSAEEADLFESKLSEYKVWFEKTTEEVSNKTFRSAREVNAGKPETALIYLFAVRESNLDEATRANGIVHRKFKKTIVQNKLLRYSLLLFFGLLVVIAVIGYVKNPPKVQTGPAPTERDSL